MQLVPQQIKSRRKNITLRTYFTARKLINELVISYELSDHCFRSWVQQRVRIVHVLRSCYGRYGRLTCGLLRFTTATLDAYYIGISATTYRFRKLFGAERRASYCVKLRLCNFFLLCRTFYVVILKLQRCNAVFPMLLQVKYARFKVDTGGSFNQKITAENTGLGHRAYQEGMRDSEACNCNFRIGLCLDQCFLPHSCAYLERFAALRNYDVVSLAPRSLQETCTCSCVH